MKEMHMAGMSMKASHGTMNMTMGGVSMKMSHGATNILPDWLAVLWTLAFLAVLVIHARHLAETGGQRRWWHAGHVLMALGMVFMYAPGSLDHFNVPELFWPIVFVNAAGIVVAWMLAQVLYGRSFNALWIVSVIDFLAMAYMWSPGGFKAPITWLLVAYFLAQAVLWATDRYRSLDEHAIGGSIEVAGDGTAAMTGLQALVCEKDLRLSMTVMTVGMAYMFAAMQLLM